MRFDLVSIFPGALEPLCEVGVVGRSRARGAVEIRVHDLRDWSDPPHRKVDDEVYGGGAGMVFRPEPMVRAASSLRISGARTSVVLPSPRGEVLTQSLVAELAEYDQLLILCDRYEGSDERVRRLVDHEVALGDFILTGGELAGLAIVDAVARLCAGVVGRRASIEAESFEGGLLDHGVYTRPESYRGDAVPQTLRGGDHAAITRWRRQDAVRQTLERRPDLLRRAALEPEVARAIDLQRAAITSPALGT